ncbi:MAG TPA: glucans biosynthesis glucosyltransferase MdoH [Albitalea sp.]|nr:glucans biosynthesis glucosyltransferase MdoH [Albitalea sp.]
MKSGVGVSRAAAPGFHPGYEDGHGPRSLDAAAALPRGSAPPIHRASMVPQPWTGFFASLRAALLRRLRGETAPAAAAADELPWQRAAARRRTLLLWAIGLSAACAAGVLAHAQPLDVHPALRIAQVGLYSLLFAWVTAGFVTAIMGFVVQLRGDRHALSAASVANRPVHMDARTAIVMPICNEQVSTVFAGLSATCESLAATGASRLFDVYLLSDTSDPAIRAAELAAWSRLRSTLGDDGARVHYRWRQRRVKRKAGNLADFCRRWGRNYRYMIVLDADSVMSGDCLLTLVRLMEANPRAGILQTAPQACGLTTVHARAQQFAGRVTGRLFTAGMHYWQLGESHYWGHNAIIRVEPFMKHCALAPLPGRGGLAGDILSHDFVEAALMRRAGYHVWLVPDLAGSYEQQPPNLLEELQRDRRWCQGNLQNARLVAEPGLHPVHRAMFGTGAMAYLSAPLWLGFVLLGALSWFFGGHAASGAGAGVPIEMMALWACTLAMLLLPRALGVLLIALKGELPLYGGAVAAVKGALVEAALSVLQAPLRMVAHSLFVFVALTGLRLDWKSPPREASAIPWRDAAQRFAPVFVLAAAALAGAAALDPRMALWLAPVALPLLLATPLSVLTSQVGLGERLRAAGVLSTPEEHRTPPVLRQAWAHVRQPSAEPRWADMVTDPGLFQLVHASMGPRDTTRGVRGRARMHLLHHAGLAQDAEAFTPAERMRLLSEPQHIARLRDRWAANAGERLVS